MSKTPPPFILLLNSFPGVGKLTIARNIRDRLTRASSISPEPHPQIRLLDNHIIIDLVSAIEPKRNASHHLLRKAVRDFAFSALQLPSEDLIILMTSCLSETQEGKEQLQEILEVAEKRGCPLVVLNLVCELEENGRRVECKERMTVEGMEKGKLVDRGLLEKFYEEYTLLDLKGLKGLEEGRVRCGSVETTRLSAEEATDVVLGFLRRELGF